MTPEDIKEALAYGHPWQPHHKQAADMVLAKVGAVLEESDIDTLLAGASSYTDVGKYDAISAVLLSACERDRRGAYQEPNHPARLLIGRVGTALGLSTSETLAAALASALRV